MELDVIRGKLKKIICVVVIIEQRRPLDIEMEKQ